MARTIEAGAYNNVDVSYPDLEPALPGTLLGSKKIRTMLAGDIADALKDQEIPTEFVQGGVSLYQVYYSSIYDDAPIVLSGLVVIPDHRTHALRHMQYHHGTLMLVPFEGGEGVLDAPSLYHGEISSHPHRTNYETRFFGLGCASQGFFVTLPDYSGYGISVDDEHPYTYHPALAIQSAHMVIAGRSLAEQLDVALEPGAFLTGWSEGAGAALATQKYLEAYHPELPVIASSLLAGPYHMSNRMGRFVLKERNDESISIYNWSVYAHNRFANEPITDAALWSYSVKTARDALRVPSNNPSLVYADGIKADHTRLDAIFEVSDLHRGWSPEGKIFLHSGKKDYIVPHAHSLSAMEGLTKEGADIKLYEYEGDHYEPVNDYFRTTMKDFDNCSS